MENTEQIIPVLVEDTVDYWKSRARMAEQVIQAMLSNVNTAVDTAADMGHDFRFYR